MMHFSYYANTVYSLSGKASKWGAGSLPPKPIIWHLYKNGMVFGDLEHSTFTSQGIWLGNSSKNTISSEEHQVFCDFYYFFNELI